MAVLLRSSVVQLALQRLAPASAAAASRLFSNTAAASGRNNSDICAVLKEHFFEAREELDEINARGNKVKADLIRLRRLYEAAIHHPEGRIGEAYEDLLQPRTKPAVGVDKLKVEAYLARLLRQSTQAGGPKLPSNVDDDARIEQAKEELLQLYLRRKPAVGASTVEADLAHLLGQFEARSQHQTSGDTAGSQDSAASISMVKDDSDWRDSCESMEPEEFSTEPYVGESDCVSGYCFSGGSYMADSYSGDMFWEKATRER